MRFKSKRKKQKKHILMKAILLLILMFFISQITIEYLYSASDISNEEFIIMLLNNRNERNKTSEVINTIVRFVSNMDLKDPISMLAMGDGKEDVIPVNEHSDEYNYEELSELSKYIKDPNPIDINKPKIYIYNSHQLENYSNKNLEIYNVTPNVMMGAYLLKEKFNNLGIPTIVEDTNLSDFMRINMWTHADSYKASRLLILDNKNKYESIEYYIDFHRDSVKKDITTATINKKNYARTLFVIGLENPNYEENLRLVNELHTLINKKYPGISRGILKKEGEGVDGVYNQDIDKNMLLLEVGGVYNNIDEVLNTIEAFSICFKEFIEDYK